MTILNLSTKKAQNLRDNAMRQAGYTLRDVYGSYSYAKERAYNYCLRKCEEEGGCDFHISSYNTFGFTVAWLTAEGVRVETPNNSYLLKY